MAGLPAPGQPGYGYPRPGSTHCTDVCTHLVWPPHAATIAFYLVVLGVLVIAGWKHLTVGYCWKCGRDNGMCRHTRDSHDSGGTPRGD